MPKEISGPLGLLVFCFNKLTMIIYRSGARALSVFEPLVELIDQAVSLLQLQGETSPKFLHNFVLAMVQCICLVVGVVGTIHFASYCIEKSKLIFSARRIRWKVASKIYARDNFQHKSFTMADVAEHVSNLGPSTINSILNATTSELRCLMAKERTAGGISVVSVLSVYISRAVSLGREYQASTVTTHIYCTYVHAKTH